MANFTYYRKDCEEVEVEYDYSLEGDMLVIDGYISTSIPVTKEEEKEILDLIADQLDDEYYNNQDHYEYERMLSLADSQMDYERENG